MIRTNIDISARFVLAIAMVRVDDVHSLPAETLLLLQNEADLAVRA